MINALTIARLGELVKITLVGRKLIAHDLSDTSNRKQTRASGRAKSANIPAVISSLLISQIITGLALVLLIVLTLPFIDFSSWLEKAISIVAGVLALVIFLIVYIEYRNSRPNFKITQRLSTSKRYQKLSKLLSQTLQSARESWSIARSPKNLVQVFSFSLATWLLQFLGTWSLLLAFHFPLSWSVAVIIVLTSVFISIAPILPGNFGVFSVACAAILTGLGIDNGSALVFATLLQIIENGVGIGGGLIFLSVEGLSFKALRKTP